MSKQRITGLVFALIVSAVLIVGIVLILSDVFSTEESELTYSTATTSDIINEVYQPVEQQTQPDSLSEDDYPDELIALLHRNPETEEFVRNYHLMKDESPEIDLSEYANTDSVPLFLQWDQRWGYASYGDDMIAISGCGPTCLSMVCVHLLGDTSLDPKTVAEFSEVNGYCIPDNGSSWTLISEGGELLGLNVEELPLEESIIIQNLLSGNPVICIMGPGDFTEGGHFIVITDYIDGKFKINDPNSIIRSEKLWSYNEIENQINNLWACSIW